MRTVRTPGRADVVAAQQVVARELRPTLVVALAGRSDVVMKLETFQPTGSFKVRGALKAVAAHLASHPGEPIVTASAGNHGLGVAFAAQRLGADATVVVPVTASAAKVAKLERYRVRLVRHGEIYDDAEQHALALAERGARYISPYNDPDVIAGQGTIGLELLDQVPDLATIVVPVGGGGLIAGIGLAASTRVGVRVVGVEAATSRAVSAARDAGRVVPVEVGATLADGLGGNLEPGSVTVELARRYVSDVVAVTEEEIEGAIRFLAAEHGLVAEGAAAVAVAAVLGGVVEPGPGTTAVVLTGRNIAPATLADVLGR